MPDPRPKAGSGLRRLFRYHILRVLLLPLAVLPRAWAQAWGAACGRLAWWFLPDLRRRSLLHLAQAFPDWTASKRTEVARQVTQWIGRSGVDFLRMGGRGHARLLASIRVEGLEHWQSALGLGRGVVAVTGHLGNWELLGSWLATQGAPVHVLYHPFAEERLDRRVNELRERTGTQLLPANKAALRGLRALRRGEVIGILIDRVPRGPAVECRFFGRECRAAPGPAWFAVKAEAPLLPVAMWHEPGRTYRVRFEAPILPPAELGSDEERVVFLTRRIHAVLEDQIRRTPEQWPWFYNRWKIRSGAVLGARLNNPEEAAFDKRTEPRS